VWTDTAAIGGENNLLTKYHEDTGRAVYNYLCASRNLLASLHGFIHPPGSCDLCCNFCFSLLLFQMHEPVPALRSVLPSVGRPPPACSITSNHRSIARRTFTETRFWRHLLLPLLVSRIRTGRDNRKHTNSGGVLEALARFQCCTARDCNGYPRSMIR
jgi:hypothetical protein